MIYVYMCVYNYICSEVVCSSGNIAQSRFFNRLHFNCIVQHLICTLHAYTIHDRTG